MFRSRRKKSTDALYILSGAAVGGILGLLFAPKKGEELRSDIKKEVDNGISKAREAVTGITDQVMDSGDELIRRASEILQVSQQSVESGYQSTFSAIENEIMSIRRAFDSAIATYKNYKHNNPVPRRRRVDKVFTTGEVEYNDDTLPKFEGMGRQQ